MNLPQIFILDFDGFMTNGSFFYKIEGITWMLIKYGFRSK